MKFEAENYGDYWRVSIEDRRGEVVVYRKWFILGLLVALKRRYGDSHG